MKQDWNKPFMPGQAQADREQRDLRKAKAKARKAKKQGYVIGVDLAAPEPVSPPDATTWAEMERRALKNSTGDYFKNQYLSVWPDAVEEDRKEAKRRMQVMAVDLETNEPIVMSWRKSQLDLLGAVLLGAIRLAILR